MPPRLVERLNAARGRYFVGRQPECDYFQSALTTQDRPFSVLYVSGSVGVGKTILLGQFARICQFLQVPAICLDAQDFNARPIEPSPEWFLNALQSVLTIKVNQTAKTTVDAIASVEAIASIISHLNHPVILIDNYELLAPLDNWFRQEFLPQLPAQTLIVLASRHSPALAWRTDPGWQALLQSVCLQNFATEDSQHYLTQRGVPATHHAAILEFTHGHPLALSLVADGVAQPPNVAIQSTAMPDFVLPNLVKTLLEKLLEEVPSSTHRQALEACAIAHRTTEATLAVMLDQPDIHALFEWLRGLSLIESDGLGLFPNPLVREALVADLRWRHPDWYAQLHQRARAYYLDRLEHTREQEQQPIGVDDHDWRVVSPTAWQEVLVDREVASSTQETARSQPVEPPVMLSQPEFVKAVQDALRCFARPDALHQNPLLRSRIIVEQAATRDYTKRIATLQAWVKQATESLQSSPRDEKLYRALYCTYLRPASTQEQAAELLDLPFSTYRRHLKAGVTRVANILWQREIRCCS